MNTKAIILTALFSVSASASCHANPLSIAAASIFGVVSVNTAYAPSSPTQVGEGDISNSRHSACAAASYKVGSYTSELARNVPQCRSLRFCGMAAGKVGGFAAGKACRFVPRRKIEEGREMQPKDIYELDKPLSGKGSLSRY